MGSVFSSNLVWLNKSQKSWFRILHMLTAFDDLLN